MKKNYYEILGVPKTATTEEIKQRYRQLVREHHPDVAANKAASQSIFLEISEAYKTLVSADRRLIYDASIDVPRPRPRPRPGPSVRRPSPPEQQTRPRTAEVQRLVREAQSAFSTGQFRSAIFACKEARKLDPKNMQAHIILGDIYRIQGQTDDAIAMYTIAVQLDPRNVDVQAKLDRLIRKSGPGAAERRASLRMGLNLIVTAGAAFALVMLALEPGRGIGWLRNFSVLAAWSPALVLVLLVEGALAGFMLSMNETVQRIDDELIFPSVRSSGLRAVSYPIGLLLVLFSLASFYAGVALYALIGFTQGSFSKSVLRSFVVVLFVVLATAAVFSPGRGSILLFGGNLVFPALCVGWAVGDIFR
ncbi:MAG: J domain-containing protein [Armatimonadota bacterium]